MHRRNEHWDWPLIRKRCLAEALRILRRPHDAEEVAQEALTRAWRRRAGCRTSPLPWCLQITRNEAFRLLSRRQIQAQSLQEEGEVAELHGPSEEVLTHERLDIYRALGELSAHERLLIALRYGYDCSHAEIARMLEIPEATARVRLHRVHKRLAKLL